MMSIDSRSIIWYAEEKREVGRMKCPCCQREMIPGILQSFDIADLYFVPESPEEPRVTLKKNMVFRSLNFQRKGYICKTCEMVLFDYKNGKS